MVKGREYFRAASLHTPHRGDVWANIGLTLHDDCKKKLSMKQKAKKKDKCLHDVREAIACFSVGHYLKNEPSVNMLKAARGTYDSFFDQSEGPGERLVVVVPSTALVSP